MLSVTLARRRIFGEAIKPTELIGTVQDVLDEINHVFPRNSFIHTASQ